MDLDTRVRISPFTSYGENMSKDIYGNVEELKRAHEQRIINDIKEAEDFPEACLTPIDVLVREISYILARLQHLETKVFWIKGN